MVSWRHILIALKALYHLGPQPVALNAIYRLGLATGHYRRETDRGPQTVDHRPPSTVCRPIFNFPSREQLLQVIGQDGLRTLLAEADEIVAGRVRLFGGEPLDLKLTFDQPLQHWTAYETGKAPIPYSLITDLPAPDIKYLWEPARFGWAFTLGRAYHLTGDEKFPQAFWRYTEAFLDANPPSLGPHWMSGQEVALRLMAFVWAAQAFNAAAASTPERLSRLAQSVAAHAARIPPTLVYARSQQNNHLLTEAAGLLTAGLALPEHPESARWRELGWKWFNLGLQTQIDGYGEYSQHSTNYHRLMLQTALWVNSLTTKGTKSHKENLSAPLSPLCLKKLASATHWLLALLDSESGRTPNLGANDGAYIFPLTVCMFADFRPVANAAARLFLNYNLPHGKWDEMSLWFGIPLDLMKHLQLPRYLGDHLYAQNSWGYLRAVRLNSRPSHADQLHFDLWWRGLNVAQDAGTYLYNALAPWDNSLTSTLVHNTVTVDGREQMTRAGRFLYVDWVNAYWRGSVDADESILQRARAHHYGYWRQGIRHERRVIVHADERWQVEDELKFMSYLNFLRRARTFRLHWLLPDWEWEIGNRESGLEVGLKSPYGVVRLDLYSEPLFSNFHSQISLVRAGETVYGSGHVEPVRGWISPTYGVKVPALSLAVDVKSTNDVKFTSEFNFPK